ncbi:hypothetical protein TEQG_01401 [Trichophyton equinum CBS 127.97]|uniref:Uncharacterized protein n=1 Tax=Trichophyton equinum (strain ATCC MYA-4606 / CBS 127.97) TaxID=559882 RepID=F2PKE4_TRIEC|nr:hypothetical protein TEQG_01401 [Trichophyton equinum CBS 127.97]
MAVPGDPAFRSLGAGSAIVRRRKAVRGPPVACVQQQQHHQQRSCMMGGRSRPTQSSGTDANVDGRQLSSQPCCLVNTWRDQSPMERMQLRRLFGLGSNTYLAGIKRQPGLSRPGRFASHQRLACLGARVRLFCKNHAAAPKYRLCFSPGIADILSTKVGLVLK